MKVSMSPRFQAVVCKSRTARIWDSSDESAGDALEGREATASQIIMATAPSKAMQDFADISGSSLVGRMWMCSCKQPARRPSTLPQAGSQDEPALRNCCGAQAINERGAGQHATFGSTVQWRACTWGYLCWY